MRLSQQLPTQKQGSETDNRRRRPHIARVVNSPERASVGCRKAPPSVWLHFPAKGTARARLREDTAASPWPSSPERTGSARFFIYTLPIFYFNVKRLAFSSTLNAKNDHCVGGHGAGRREGPVGRVCLRDTVCFQVLAWPLLNVLVCFQPHLAVGHPFSTS